MEVECISIVLWSAFTRNIGKFSGEESRDDCTKMFASSKEGRAVWPALEESSLSQSLRASDP